MTEVDAKLAAACWKRILETLRQGDDRELWFAWRAAFQHRFWKGLGERSAAALCAREGVNHSDLLKRLTAYEFAPNRNRDADAKRLEREILSPTVSAGP